MQRSPLIPMLERVCEVAVLPHVIFSILEPMGPNEPTPDELEEVISVDPGFAAKVLVLANSGAFCKQGQVVALHEGIELIGYRTLRTLAMTAGTFEMFVGKNDPNSLRRRRWWRHSVDTAICCRWLARESHRASPSEAYTIGLLHLIGKTLLDRYGGADYTLVTERQASGERDYEAETAVYGCTHIELLVALGQQWHLPVRLLETLEYQCPPEFGREFVPLRACLAIGTRLASAATRGPDLGVGDLADCPDWAIASLGLSRDQLRLVLDEGIEAIASCQ